MAKRPLAYTMEPVAEDQLRLFRERSAFLLQDPTLPHRELRDVVANAYAQGVWDTAEAAAMLRSRERASTAPEGGDHGG
jgi:hypothetical protein